MQLFPQSRPAKIRLAILSVIALVLLTRCGITKSYEDYQPQEGDIIFQSLPHGELVDMIEGVSQSPYSHCGVVVKRNGQWFVNEAIEDVHDTPLADWIFRGRDHRFSVYRLKDELKPYIPAFIRALDKYQGRPYDYQYQMDDDYIYCSELVFKAFKDATGMELGKLVRLGDLNWSPYEATIRKYDRGNLPLDQLIITPRHLSEAPQLVKVVEH